MKATTQEVLQGYFDELLCPSQPSAVTVPKPALKLEMDSASLPFQDPEPEAASAPSDQAREKLVKLLSSSALSEPAVVVASEEDEPPVLVQPQDTTPVSLVQEESTVAAALEQAVEEEGAAASTIPAADADSQGSDQSLVGWLENGRPSWAQERFEVLLFEVAGLTLAVPLVALGQIQPLTEELTPLFGQADWFMGLQPTPVGKIRTINTARFVMPERYQDSFVEGAKYVVSIDGLPWGLAVDQVNQPITLAPEDVKWRGERSKRPWLAGTVKQHMCALLDIHTMGAMLQHADADRSRRDPLKAG